MHYKYPNIKYQLQSLYVGLRSINKQKEEEHAAYLVLLIVKDPSMIGWTLGGQSLRRHHALRIVGTSGI